MKNIIKLITGILICLCLVFSINQKAEATHHYLWSNRDYAFWMDDIYIHSGPNKDWCMFKIVIEDMPTGKLKLSDEYMVIYKRNGEWCWTYQHDDQSPHTIEYYNEWWQPWGLKWLLDNGYLLE